MVAAATAAGALAARYARGRARADAAATTEVGRRLTDIGEVASLTVLPLVERLVDRPGLRGEPGVSYLVRADGTTLLFDCGLAQGKQPAPLEVNAELLGEDASGAAAMVISHLHADHVGGIRAMRERTFAVPEPLALPGGVPALVPTDMSHPRADVSVVGAPRVVAPGVAVLPPLPRMLFWLGFVAEQALVVNVRGFGLVVITGCGHPPIESTLAAAERALDVPVQGVVGGLHLPVHPLGTGLIPQAVLGNPHWPWQPISEADARTAIDAIAAYGPKVVALSGHDSTPWTYDEFGRVFGPAYQTLRVGEPLVIDSSTGS
jgi:7,8-dihydropterin-6-yl-methyl-4-(beta-D-ribofuranosyl)aminobenzene 5'-phosphate synthase